MSKYLKLFFLSLAISINAAWAGDVEDGDAAIANKDYATALKKYKIAATKNNSNAQNQVGNIYKYGLGVKQDNAEAVRWYRLAAEQGNASAQSNLAIIYNNGEGVIQDYVESVRWHKLAAAQGDSNAQLNLGIKFMEGKGVSQDSIRSYMWLNLAAVSGDEMSIAFRKIIASKMTSQQIAEAQKLARECQVRNFKNCD